MKSSIIIVSLLISMAACGQVTPTPQPIDIKSFSKTHQVLLTNEGNFKEHSSLLGASCFLIDYNNKKYAVTAQHLIGEAGGIIPEIKPNQLSNYIESWYMYPRVANSISNDTIFVKSKQLNYNKTTADCLLLEIEDYQGTITALKPEFKLPQQNERLYILGCPYAQEDCYQNVYGTSYVEYDKTSQSLSCILDLPIETAGFSGAPLINQYGNVVGIVTASWEDNGTNYIMATSIRAIKNIK